MYLILCKHNVKGNPHSSRWLEDFDKWVLVLNSKTQVGINFGVYKLAIQIADAMGMMWSYFIQSPRLIYSSKKNQIDTKFQSVHHTSHFSIMPSTSLSYHPLLYHTIHFSIIPSTSLSYHPLLYYTIHISVTPSTSLSYHPLLYHTIHFSVTPSTSLSHHPVLYHTIQFSIIPSSSLT